MVEISGNPELTDDPYRLTVVVKDTRDFTSSELILTTAVAVTKFAPKDSEMEPGSNWDIWRNGRFGKLLRRLKPSLFDRMVDSTEGFLYTDGNVSVFVIEPLRRSDLPSIVKKGQVAGLQVVEKSLLKATEKYPHIVITLNNSLNMSVSKAAIAGAHALQLLRDSVYLGRSQTVKDYFDNSNVEVLWTNIDNSDMSEVVVRDAGLTEVAPGSITATAKLK